MSVYYRDGLPYLAGVPGVGEEVGVIESQCEGVVREWSTAQTGMNWTRGWTTLSEAAALPATGLTHWASCGAPDY